MSTLTITSPGVQINEVDISLTANTVGSTNVLIVGFTPQGPTEEFTNVTSISEYEATFGTPTNSAERYLYHSARQILNTSPANLLVTRLPYASAGYASSYSALVYPISSDSTTYASSSSYKILAPTSIILSDSDYLNLVQNNITWATGYTSNIAISGISSLSQTGGIVVINSAKTSVDDLFQGYYVGLCDNSNINPSTDYTAITGIQAVTSQVKNGSDVKQSLSTVPSTRLNFSLSASSGSFSRSISQFIETVPTGYNLSTGSFNDSLILALFKIRTSTYAQDTVTLDYVVSETYAGSLNALRTQNNPNGGKPVTFFLDNVVDNVSNNIHVITNPYISNNAGWTGSDGAPTRTVRVDTSAGNLYSVGTYAPLNNNSSKDVGNVPLKLQRVLNQLQNNDSINIDVVAEAGLGTIWAGAKSLSATKGTAIYDENVYLDLGTLTSISNGGYDKTGAGGYYYDIATQFVAFATDSRKDHVFIADPLRHIFVQGANGKTSSSKNYNFANDIYWPINNLVGGLEQSSYTVTYGNWIKYNDAFSNTQVWLPASAYVAAKVASTTQSNFPWTAVAGFNYGALSNVIDIAVNPTQKQRDILYKSNINPIAWFPNDGYVIYGQKTLYGKPSAFDRLNVRRLFLTLEKETQAALKFFLFEPNTFSTQQRLINTLKPVFDNAKINNGLYDYLIVCDGRNNTPSVIDNNQLAVSIYIQPVKTAEFILCDFIATQTGVNFTELVGQGTL